MSVHGVADNRVAEMREMDTDLVRSSCLGHHLEKAEFVESFNHLKKGFGVPTCVMVGSNCHLFTLPWVGSDRLFDNVAVPVGPADDNREIGFGHGPVGKLGRNIRVSLVVFGDDDTAARVPIQAVDNSWSMLAPAVTEMIETVDEGTGEGSLPVPDRGVDHHASGFINDNDVHVLEYHIKGYVLPNDLARRKRGRRKVYHLARVKPRCGFDNLAIRRREAGGNCPAQLGTAQALNMRREKDVESLALFFFRDGEL